VRIYSVYNLEKIDKQHSSEEMKRIEEDGGFVLR
jgi:hypothetical protein